MKEKPESNEATSLKPPSKLERTSSKDTQNDRKSESMVDTRDKGVALPEHSSTAELVGVRDTEDVAEMGADQAPIADAD